MCCSAPCVGRSRPSEYDRPVDDDWALVVYSVLQGVMTGCLFAAAHRVDVPWPLAALLCVAVVAHAVVTSDQL